MRQAIYFPLDQPPESTFDPSYVTVRHLFQEIRNIAQRRRVEKLGVDPAVSHHVLTNGMTVGEFCVWYIASGRTISRPLQKMENVSKKKT